MVTNAERANWQGLGARLVTEFVAMGGENDLPPLVWSIDHIGDIRGEVPESEEDPTAVFTRWCRLLGAGDQTSYDDTSYPIARTVSLAWVHKSMPGYSPMIALAAAVPVTT